MELGSSLPDVCPFSENKMSLQKNLLRTFTITALALGAVVFSSQAWITPRVDAQDVRTKFQHDLGQVFNSHQDLRFDARLAAERIRETGRLSLVTSSQNLELQLTPNDLRAANYRAVETGPNGIERKVTMSGFTTYKGK